MTKMKMCLLSVIFYFIAFLFLLTPAFAQNLFVVPIVGTNSEGDSLNLIPFNCAAGGVQSMRYQQVYLGSSLGTGTISKISFRLDESNPSAFGPVVIPNIQIDMSTTPPISGNLSVSNTFANNIGPNVVTVFSGDLSLSAPDCITNPSNPSDPCPFDIMIPLQTQFFYEPSEGNLLVDIRVPTCVILGGSNNVLFDAVRAFDTARLWVYPIDELDGTVDDSYGLITQFEITPPPPVEAQVPTLSEWGLVAMATILGIVGFMVIRRRKVIA